MQAILDALARMNDQSVGTLHRKEGAALERRDFETLVSALGRAGLVTIRELVERNLDQLSDRLAVVELRHRGTAWVVARLAGKTKHMEQRRNQLCGLIGVDFETSDLAVDSPTV